MCWWKSRRNKPRCYAKLDPQGRCLALWRLDARPVGRHWVEVRDLDARQIGLKADQLTTTDNYISHLHRGVKQQAQRAPACSRIAT